ncbi:hypothetical protein HK104_007034, partial [Borealophlyctis nickersoniae]
GPDEGDESEAEGEGVQPKEPVESTAPDHDSWIDPAIIAELDDDMEWLGGN